MSLVHGTTIFGGPRPLSSEDFLYLVGFRMYFPLEIERLVISLSPQDPSAYGETKIIIRGQGGKILGLAYVKLGTSGR